MSDTVTYQQVDELRTKLSSWVTWFNCYENTELANAYESLAEAANSWVSVSDYEIAFGLLTTLDEQIRTAIDSDWVEDLCEDDPEAKRELDKLLGNEVTPSFTVAFRAFEREFETEHEAVAFVNSLPPSVRNATYPIRVNA